MYYPCSENKGAKTKVLISFAVTAKLICAFVFAYADCWFSHAATQIRYTLFYTWLIESMFALEIVTDILSHQTSDPIILDPRPN